jgi:hypothetical protein
MSWLVAFAASISPRLETIMKTTADRLREEGLTQGLTQGQIKLLRHLLERRFGPLPPEFESRLRAATSAELERWAEAVLAAASIEEVFGS